MTFREALQGWCSGTGGAFVSPRWEIQRNRLLERFALPALAGLELHELTASHVFGVVRAIRAAGLANKTANDGARALIALARDYAREGEVSGDVVAALRNGWQPLRRDSRRVFEPWTADEAGRIVEAFRQRAPEYAAFVAWQFATGARPGESLAARWVDVDLAGRRWRIERSRDGRRFTPCKTERSRRVIPLARRAVAALSTVPRGDDGELVFVTPAGNWLNLGNFDRRTWRSVLEQLPGVPTRPLYAARATFASLQLSSGNMTLAQLGAYLGDLPETVARHYARFLPGYFPDSLDAGFGWSGGDLSPSGPASPVPPLRAAK